MVRILPRLLAMILPLAVAALAAVPVLAADAVEADAAQADVPQANASKADAAKADAAKAKAAAEMPWETSYATALKKSEESGKPILFDFYTGWCPHCTRMDKTTWKDAELIKMASASFVSAKINADVEKAPVSRYRLIGYPTMILASAGGDQILRMEGYVDAAGMKRAMKAYVDGAADIGEARKTLASDKKNVPAQLTLASIQEKAGLHEQAADTYAKIAKSAQGEEMIRASAGAGLSLSRAGRAKDATKILAKGLEAAGPNPPPVLLLALAENEKALGNPAQAKTWREKLLAEHPGSPEAALAQAE